MNCANKAAPIARPTHVYAGSAGMLLQRASLTSSSRASGSEDGTAPAVVHEVLRSGTGQPLNAATRAFMEPRFGHDFSPVRVHADATATRSAREVGANAYTVGRQVVFGARQYAPHTDAGRRLIAHELMLIKTAKDNGVDMGFFELEESLVTDLAEQGLVWGATFPNVDLHHFEMS